MFAIAIAGFLTGFSALVSLSFLGPLANTSFILPLLAVSIILTIFGSLRAPPIRIVITTVGGAVSFAGMSAMRAMLGMTIVSNEAVLTAWIGISLVASSFLIVASHRQQEPASLLRITTTNHPLMISEKPVAAFITSVVGGVIILLASLFASTFSMTGMFASMMTYMVQMADHSGGSFGFFHFLTTTLGLVSGSIVTVGAVMMYLRPQEISVWGGIVLAFSVLSLVSVMGGLLIGLILGVMGGALAIGWKPAHLRS